MGRVRESDQSALRRFSVLTRARSSLLPLTLDLAFPSLVLRKAHHIHTSRAQALIAMSVAVESAAQVEYTDTKGLFTCLSCSIAFLSANDQRTYLHTSYVCIVHHSYKTFPLLGDHYRSDHHRYNMKRRVAGLPPVSAEVFNNKVLERRAETAIMASPKGSTCEVCGCVVISGTCHLFCDADRRLAARLVKSTRQRTHTVPI